ncbi:MAG: hydrolase [Flavobacteriaceae bacterium]|nr:hydrolase [Flavobacteriaceae bacterium]
MLFHTIFFINAQIEKRTVTVKKIDQKIILNGVLDENVWSEADSAKDFWQQFPTDSIKALDKTEVKLLYNDTHLFIGVTAYSIGGKYTINSLRRDYSSRNNDNVTILFDTFKDGQNGFLFGLNAYGVQREALLSDRGIDARGFNLNWDTKWKSASKNFDNKYVLEIAIPFSSIKYPENSKIWGFQSYRYDFQRNERSIWTNVVQNQFPINIGFFGEIIFEEPLKKNKTPLYIIPYINGLTSKEYSAIGKDNFLSIGGDLKIAVGTGLNLDITLNPDFSNVEVDDVITNLTRFEITLPEKRQFFIDNGDLFGSFGSFRDAIPFFSRRIGIEKDSEGNTIQNDIIGGVRLSGKLDENWRLGFLNIQNREDLNNEIASNNNSMFAIQRKVFGESQVGFFMVNKQAFKDYDFLNENDSYNRVIGLDYNLASSNNRWTGKFYTHKSFQPNDNKGNLSSFARILYNTRIWRILSATVYVDEDFRSDLGFIRRTGIIKTGNSITRNFYPKSGKINSHSFQFRHLSWFQQNLNYLKTDESSYFNYTLRTNNQNQLEFEFNRKYVFLFKSFDPSRSPDAIALPVNSDYRYNEWSLNYRLNYANPFIFSFENMYGGFFNGTKFSSTGSIGYRFQPKLIFTLQWDYNKIKLPKPYSSNDIILVRPKFDITFSKKIFWSTLIQYSNLTKNLGINSRLQWRFAPLSDLYLVYNDNYYTQEFGPVFRSINLKLTYWLNI